MPPPLLLHNLRYCNTIARPLRNIRPAIDLLFVCHTSYNIGDGNLRVKAKGRVEHVLGFET